MNEPAPKGIQVVEHDEKLYREAEDALGKLGQRFSTKPPQNTLPLSAHDLANLAQTAPNPGDEAGKIRIAEEKRPTSIILRRWLQKHLLRR